MVRVIVSVDPEFLFNLETTEGVIEKSAVTPTVKAIPNLTGANNIQLTGLAKPGTSSIEIIQNGIKISEFFTGLDGSFSVQIDLLLNQLNQLSVRARNGGSVTERNIEIRQDSTPSFSFLTTAPEYINTESVVLAYNLTDAHGGPAGSHGELKPGNAAIISDQIHLSNLVEGSQILELEIFDQLNNRISQSYPLFVDFSSPILETIVPEVANQNFTLALSHNENLSSLHYRFYSNQISPPQYIPVQDEVLINFDFQDVQGTHILDVQAVDLSQNISNYSTQILFDSIPPYFLII